jgi:general secretion pathway protein I
MISMHDNQHSRGFTLVEVAIALAILVIVLTAAGRASQTAISGAQTLRNQTLAQWVAENRVARRYANRAWISVGTYTGIETQAGITYQWREQVSTTPNPVLLRLDVTVAELAAPDHTIAAMAGFIARERD